MVQFRVTKTILSLILVVVALVGGCASTPKAVANSPETKAAIEAENQDGPAEQVPTERDIRNGEILLDILEILSPLIDLWLNAGVSEERKFVYHPSTPESNHPHSSPLILSVCL